MCGLTGYCLSTGKNEQSLSTIKGMLSLQRHRGPDDVGMVGISSIDHTIQEYSLQDEITKSDANVMFGFNRLSILDLSANGHQPMIDFERKIVLMLNGEIYNAFDFKNELIQKGHRFKSTSDTEIVLKLYIEYGLEGMLSRLNGMFAIVLYDGFENTVTLIRDRFGIKPLYVLHEPERIAFSSEMKSFKALADFDFQLNETDIDEFLLFRNLINKTLFKNIVNIEPGEYWVIKPSLEVVKNQYFDINKSTYKSDELTQDRLEEILQKSVKRQLISDVKLGSQLSGGVDSSLISFFAGELIGHSQLETISIIPDQEKYSEEVYIDQVIHKLGLRGHKYELNSKYYLNELDKVVWHFEQPLNHPNTIGIYLLSQMAKQHVTVLLSGEGADEVLAGYKRFVTFSGGAFPSHELLGFLKRNKRSIHRYGFSFLNKDIRLILANSFSSIDSLVDIKANFNFQNSISQRLAIYQELTGDPLLKQRKYEIKTYLPDLLMRQDKMSMAHSIENRVPFLDNELVDFSLQLGSKVLLGEQRVKEPKLILKKIAENKFGHEFAFRSKKGFPIPLREFLNSDEFYTRWNDEWLPTLKDRGIFNYKLVNSWVNNLDAISPDKLNLIWLTIGFESWAKQYLNGK